MQRKFEKIFFNIIRLLTFFSIITLILISIFIIKESLPVFDSVALTDFLFGTKWYPVSDIPQVSILPMILATLYISLLALVIALPIGVGAAVLLACVLGEKTRRLIKPFIDVMAGIPSVIYGLIGLLVLVKFFETHLDFASGESVLAGGILLSIMILPYIISTCDESMLKISSKYKLASNGLGISKWHMIRYLVLPASLKSILAGIILAFARAMGETMAVMLVIGNSPIFPRLLNKAQTIPALIALEMGGAQVDSIHYHALFAAGFVLMVMLFIINAIFYQIKKRNGI